MTATAAPPETQWVARIYPRVPSRGYLARIYLLSNSGYPKFEEHRGWYGIDEEIIPRLKRARNISDDPDSKPVFQVCTLEQAIAIEEAEELVAAAASKPIPVPRSRLNKLRAKGLPAVKPKPRVEKPAFFESADPEDPEDQEFMTPTEWDESDMAPETDVAPARRARKEARGRTMEPVAEKPVRRAAKKKATKKAAKKKPTRAAKKKATKKAAKKRK